MTEEFEELAKQLKTTNVNAKWFDNVKYVERKPINDDINHPKHYTYADVECIEIMEQIEGRAAVADYCICNCWKYLYRHNNKGGREDIKKLVWYAQRYLDMTKEEEDETE